MDLTSCRSVGFSQGPIPWTAVRSWAIAHRITEEEFWQLENLIPAMDSVWLGHVRARTERASKTPSGAKLPVAKAPLARRRRR